MKKKTKIILLISMLTACVLVFAGCEAAHRTGNRITGGKDVQTFTYCYVVLGGQEVVKGAITQWRDYDNSDVVQVLVNGKFYLTHYSNVVLIADPDQGALAYSDVSYGWDPINE